jgi:hypothetical protein
MDNLKKMNFTELDPSEMKLVQGGGWLEDLVVVLGSLEAVAAYLGKTVDEVRAMLGL